VAVVRTLFGAKARPHRDRAGGPPRLAALIETPTYDLTNFKVHFGRLTLKAYTKGEHVLRVEAIAHNTSTSSAAGSWTAGATSPPASPTWLSGSAPPSTASTSRSSPTESSISCPPHHSSAPPCVGGIDLNKARMRNALAAVLALAVSPTGFSVGEFTEKVRAMTGQSERGYTIRQGAYDLCKLRGKQLLDKPGRSRRYHVPDDAVRTIAGIVTLRDHVIAPILAGVRSPRLGRKPSTWTRVDRDYENLRITMHTLLSDLAIDTPAAA